MEKERLFELIRKEEILLFAGAGFSMYAGYPSGKDLAKTMHANLTPSQQNEIQLTSDLLQVTEDIYNLKNGNKNFLIEILKKEFQKEPSSIETHQLLAKIPQIKTIITTNYDDLFERTNKKLEVIRRSSDYSIVSPKKQHLFKIHGDLTDTQNIILTKSDYNNFFIDNKVETVFWNAVKDKLASNHILFIGYSLEDSNVMYMFEKILRELGENRKELFFVAPSINSSKTNYLTRKGIEFIESSGEDLIKEIFEDLKLNYFPGLSNGQGSADTAFNFGLSNQLNVTITKNNNNLLIHSFSSQKKVAKNEVKFNLDTSKNDSKKLLDALRGKNFDDILIKGEYIKDWSHFIDGIRMSKDNVSKVWVKKVPNIHGKFEFVFEDGFELDNYNMDIFIISPEENKSQMKIMFVDFTVIIEMIFNDKNTQYKIDIRPNKLISSVKSGLNFYNLFSRITNNQKFTIFKDDKLFYSYENKIKFEEDSFDAKFLKDYFQKLKKIEQHFNIKFSNIDFQLINENILEKILAFVENRALKVEFNGLSFINKNRDEIDHILETCKDKGVFLASENFKSTYSLHGLNFETGYLNQIIEDAFVVNREDLIKNNTNKVELKSRSESMQIQFSDQKDMLLN